MSVELEPVRVDIEPDRGARVSPGLRNGLAASAVVSGLIVFTVWFLAEAIPDKIESPVAPIPDLAAWLAGTRIGIGLLESLYAFPIVEGLHLISIAVSVGVLCWFDLRLLGLVFKDQPVSKVWRQMMPVAAVGFAVVFITGALLFTAEAMTAHDSVHFWIKVGLIIIAGVNAAYFEFKVHPGIAPWDNDAVPPRPARIAGLVSLVCWTAIIITGRTMAYSF